MRLIDADLLQQNLAKEPMESRTYFRANEIVINSPTAFDLESMIKKLIENNEKVIKIIRDRSPSEFNMIKIMDLVKLFEEYTQEQIDILKSAVNATNGKNGG